MSALEDLLDQLDTVRERTLVALEALPDEALVTPGVIGRWSIADLLSILTAWDAEVVTGMMQLQAGKSPERLLAALRNPDIYNAQRYQDARGRTLDVIFDDFQRSRTKLEEWLSELTERALTDPKHFRSLGGASLGRIIADATHRHETRYLPFLTTFADRWEDAEPEVEEPGVAALGEPISLADIDILGAPGANGNTAEFTFPEDDDDDFE